MPFLIRCEERRNVNRCKNPLLSVLSDVTSATRRSWWVQRSLINDRHPQLATHNLPQMTDKSCFRVSSYLQNGSLCTVRSSAKRLNAFNLIYCSLRQLNLFWWVINYVGQFSIWFTHSTIALLVLAKSYKLEALIRRREMRRYLNLKWTMIVICWSTFNWTSYIIIVILLPDKMMHAY